jgi:hypothetical protein
MRHTHTAIVLLIGLMLFLVSGCSTQNPEALVDVKTRSGVGIEIQPVPHANQSDEQSGEQYEDDASSDTSSTEEQDQIPDVSTEVESGDEAQDVFDDYLSAKEAGLRYERDIELTKLNEIETTDTFNDIKVEDGMVKIYHAFEIPNSCLNVTYDIVSEEGTVYIVPKYVDVPMPHDFEEDFSEQECVADVYEPVIFDIEHDEALEDIALFSYKRTNLTYLHIILS